MTIDQLFVIWRAPNDGSPHIVGRITRQRESSIYRFWYEDDLAAAFAQGFMLFAAFPEHRRAGAPYEARYLFATFSDRTPSPRRADAPQMLASWGVEHSEDQFEVLAKSGGLRATDRVELAEFRDQQDPLFEPIEFRIAGVSHVPSSSRGLLALGEPLRFERESQPLQSRFASIVARTSSGMRAGHVPRQYSAMIARLLDLGVALSAVTLRELILPDDAPRWVVRASRAS